RGGAGGRPRGQHSRAETDVEAFTVEATGWEGSWLGQMLVVNYCDRELVDRCFECVEVVGDGGVDDRFVDVDVPVRQSVAHRPDLSPCHSELTVEGRFVDARDALD